MKPINWKKGFFRFTLVLSLFVGIFFVVIVGLLNGFLDDDWSFFFGGLVCFGLIWLIYFIVGFILRGFTSQD